MLYSMKGRCIGVSLFPTLLQIKNRSKIVDTFPEDRIFLHDDMKRKHDRETPQYICISGSITVEAAIIIPMCACFFAFVLFYFQIMQIYISVQSALEQAGGRIAVLSELEMDENRINSVVETKEDVKRDIEYLALVKGQIYLNLKENAAIAHYVSGGAMGISLLTSEFDGDYILLKANYRVKFPIKLFGIIDFSVTQKTRFRKWTGWHSVEETKGELFVYVTEHGEVYHLRKSCPYLDLSIRCTLIEEIPKLRNENGEKYIKCQLCKENEMEKEKVYITDYGNKYHSSINCTGLKRMIYQKKRSELGGMSRCVKCSM